MKNTSEKSAGKRIALAVCLGVGIYLFCFGFIALIICGSLGFFPTAQSKRQKLADSFSNDGNYSVLLGRANIFYYYENESFLNIELTLKEVQSDNTRNYPYVAGKTYRYSFIPSNRSVLEDNGISGIYGAADEKNGTTYHAVEQTVTITVIEEFLNGTYPTAVSLSIGGKEYLSYETGKANMISYIRYEMH